MGLSQIDKRAELIIQEGRIVSLVQYPTSTIWVGEVLDKNFIYTAYLDSTGKQADSCECAEFAKDQICPHILAIDKQLEKNHRGRPIAIKNKWKQLQDRDVSTEWIEFFKKQVLTEDTWSFSDIKQSHTVSVFAQNILLDKIDIDDVTFKNNMRVFDLVLHYDVNKRLLTVYKKPGHQSLLFFKKQSLIIKGNCGYRMDKLTMAIAERLESTLQEPMIIQSQWMSDFLTYVLPIIEKVATITSNLKDVKTNVAKLYLQKGYDNKISITKKYETVDVYMKDVDLERHIHQVLTQADFESNGRDDYTRTFANSYDLNSFLVSDLPQLEKQLHIQVEETLKQRIMDFIDEPVISIDEDSSLLRISFDFKDISQKDVADMLQALYNEQSVYELKDGRVVSLESSSFDTVHKTLAAIRSQAIIENGQIKIHRANIGQLSFLAEHANSSIQQLIKDLMNPNEFKAELPLNLHAILKPYQVTGFRWLKMLDYYRLGGVLADDMGLGKTVQSITYILSILNENPQKSVLIIAPASLLYNWSHEIRRFAPTLDCIIVAGTKKQREDIINSMHQVFITSYQSFRQDAPLYSDKHYRSIILDESQMVKNPATKLHKSLRHLNTEVIFALSGTPIENKKEDLWSVFSIVLPGLFPTIQQFKHISDAEIYRTILPFTLRRLKESVLTQLPQKMETTLYHEMTKEQKTLYLGYLQRMQQVVGNYSPVEMRQNRIAILSGITRLRQICDHPRLFVESYEGESGKLNQFLDVVDRAISGGHRLLVFSQFSTMLDLLEEALAKKGYTAFKLTGKTPIGLRNDMVQQFNAGENDVFLISLKAGGTGLNLTSADTIVLYDLWWNPAVEEQATSRAHRIGQNKIVQVYRLIASGTIEEQIIRLQEQKREIFSSLIGTDSTSNDRMTLTQEDIYMILGMQFESDNE